MDKLIPNYNPCAYCFDFYTCGNDEKTTTCKKHVVKMNETIKAKNEKRKVG